jgi:hypothetical protein
LARAFDVAFAPQLALDIVVDLEMPSSPPVALNPRGASTPAMPQPDLDTTPVAIPSLRTVPALAASATSEGMTAAARLPHEPVEATLASDVATPDHRVVASVARTSAPKKIALSAPAPVEQSFTNPLEAVGAQAECQPPYVVDATTGKKHWKLECL